jgi:hypothetical protein
MDLRTLGEPVRGAKGRKKHSCVENQTTERPKSILIWGSILTSQVP